MPSSHNNLRQDLNYASCRRNPKERPPEVTHRLGGIDVASIAKAKRYTGQRHSDREEDDDNTPSSNL